MLKFIAIAATLIACAAAAPGLASLGHGPILGGYGLSAPAISAPIAKIAAPSYSLGLGHGYGGIVGAPLGLGSHGLAYGSHGLALGGHGLALGGHGLALGGHGLALGGHGLALGGHGLALGGHGYGLGIGAHGLGGPIW